MTFSWGLDLWNIQLWAECLLGNGGHTMPQPFFVNPYTAFTWGRHWAAHRPFWNQVENLPMFTQWLEPILRLYVLSFICIGTNSSWSIFNLRFVGDTLVVMRKIFIVEFGQKSRFLLHHATITTILSPVEGRAHHIDYMFIYLSCMYQNEK